jgi:4'-phosphopantetheinyl transferase EntD
MTSSFQEILASLLPQDVKFAAGRIRDAPRDTFASEELAISHAVEKRRHEFSAGRAYARLALAACGCTPQPIPVGADRRPVWPKGYVGSISRSDRLCAAVVSRADQYAGLSVSIPKATLLSRQIYGTWSADRRSDLAPSHLAAILQIALRGEGGRFQSLLSDNKSISRLPRRCNEADPSELLI